jgi:hypothetical protein
MSKPTNPTEDFAWAVKTGDLPGVKDFVEKQKLSPTYVDPKTKRTPLQ